MTCQNGCSSNAFSQDIKNNKGYLYTTNCSLSSQMANRRLTDAALSLVDFKGKSVLDVGCGDGSYTRELFKQGGPDSIRGIDSVQEAVSVASQKNTLSSVTFEVQSAEALSYQADSFDVVHIRGVLHHMDDPRKALQEALRVAPVAVVIEPNGYNPVVKVLERFSRYHVLHKEKSYAPMRLASWVREAGGEIVFQGYVGLVPFFCPDWMAKVLKAVEPAAEQLPLINSLVCAAYIFVARRVKSEGRSI